MIQHKKRSTLKTSWGDELPFESCFHLNWRIFFVAPIVVTERWTPAAANKSSDFLFHLTIQDSISLLCFKVVYLITLTFDVWWNVPPHCLRGLNCRTHTHCQKGIHTKGAKSLVHCMILIFSYHIFIYRVKCDRAQPGGEGEEGHGDAEHSVHLLE